MRNGADIGPKANPYLVHMYHEPKGYSDGYASGRKSKNNLLAGLTRHETTAEHAKVAEDRPYNPLNELE